MYKFRNSVPENELPHLNFLSFFSSAIAIPPQYRHPGCRFFSSGRTLVDRPRIRKNSKPGTRASFLFCLFSYFFAGSRLTAPDTCSFLPMVASRNTLTKNGFWCDKVLRAYPRPYCAYAMGKRSKIGVREDEQRGRFLKKKINKGTGTEFLNLYNPRTASSSAFFLLEKCW